MPEKETRAKSRKERREVARSRAILDVANELNMDLFRSGRDYRWKEHHSLVISPDNNLWQWFSRHVGGDVISLVETIKEVNFNQAVDFLNDGDFKTFQRVERKEEPFNYYLNPYEQPFIEARNYLKHQRKLSDETIDFFLDQGVMAQANAKVHGSIEPVIVFKSLTQEGEIIGAQLQGIEANWKKWPERGYAKKIVNNSDGMTGLHVDIGQPKRLIFTESSIDLMSYYELHKDSLQDVRLVSMDGLKESIVGRHLVELEAELSGRPLRWNREELSRGLTTAIDNGYFAEGKHTDMITLAVDNDAGGRNFITSLQDKGVSLIVDIPDLPEGQEKADWNSYLQQENKDWLENNWDNITSSIERKEPNYTNQIIQKEKLAEYPYLVRLTSGSRLVDGQLFRQGETVRYEEFVTALYHTRQDYQSGDEETISFDVLAPNGNSIARNFHYHLPTDTKQVSELIPHEGLQAYEQATVNLSEIMAANQEPEIEASVAEGLSLSDIQESLSNEGELVSTIASDSSVIYTNTVNFDQAYSLNLEVHSPEEVDNLSDIKAPWTLEVTRDNHSLGYLAYGEDWGNDFNVEDDLVSLDSWITRNRVENHLYSQEEVNSFLEPLTAEKEAVGELKSYGTFIIDDDFLERRYGSVEHDNSIRTAVEKLSNLIGFDDMPTNDQETEWVHTKKVDFEGTQLILDVYSSSEDKIFEGKNKNNNWSIAVLGENGPLGFLTYGEAWLDDINEDFLRPKLTDLQTWITEGSISKHLYTQQDYNQFNASLKEKAPEKLQETVASNLEQIKKNETILGDLSEQAQEAAPVPEVIKSQPLKELSPTQSESHSLLHFTIQKPDKSMYKRNYHIIDEEDLFKLNNNADIVQNSARWYLDNLADRTIHYFYQKEDRVYSVNLHFEERHYMHLTGIFPIKDGQTAEKTLHDFAAGRGDYDNIMISNRDATFQKIKALPDMKAILNANSFYFDNVDDIPKLHSLTMEQAIQSDDKDVLLAFQSNGENLYPASLMEVTKQLKKQLTNAEHANVILGVYSEKDGEITPLSINHRYVSDNGEEMFSILQNKQYQEVPSEQIEMPEPNQPELTVTSEDFTKVLDAVYNNGAQVGKDNRDNIPEALHPAWDKYDEYAAQHDNDFKQIMVAAEKDHLLDKNSDFYKAWSQDDIYENRYHVRLQDLSEGITLPFSETDFIDYQDFARELYHQNQRSQVGDEVTNATVNFAIYAPGGDLVKEGVGYHIGEESKPISQLLGLGYRRLAGYQDLAQMDNNILSQLENQTLNQTIAEDIAESVPTSRETRQEVTASHNEAKTITSEREVLKNRFQRRVEEILNESPVQNQVNHRTGDIIINNSTVASNNSMIINSGIMSNRQTDTSTIHKTASSPSPKKSSESVDYQKVSAYELSQAAFQKIREYTQSPKDLAEYLDFMSKFPTLSPRNVALIQAQWPGANAVATYNQWQAMGDSLGLSKDDVMQTKA
ncbi:toprim domain-containing protein, partial [Streptococcus pasteurianus]|nr:toprim domain-containing protein [Streptococcus pasteurianus]